MSVFVNVKRTLCVAPGVFYLFVVVSFLSLETEAGLLEILFVLLQRLNGRVNGLKITNIIAELVVRVLRAAK